MSRATAVPVIARRKMGRPDTVAALMWVWGRASVVAVPLTLSLVLLGEGAPGDLDPTFGVRGKVTTDFGGLISVASALVLQPDGKLVAAGASESTDPLGDFALVRYLPDGRLDPRFGVGGQVTTDFGGSEDEERIDFARALVLQPDGKLVALGSSRDFSDPAITGFDWALARYLADGSLDPTFGAGGTVTTDFASLGLHDEASALVLQPDGKLVAAGVFNTSAGGDFGLARYVEQQPVFNDFVTFEPLPATFHFTPDSTGCPEGFVGTFSFEARLTNSSDRSLSDLVIEVIALTGNHLLQNADGGPEGVGAHLTVPRQDGFTEGVLAPDEFVDVPFIICLRQQQPFRLVVDVLGDAE